MIIRKISFLKNVIRCQYQVETCRFLHSQETIEHDLTLTHFDYQNFTRRTKIKLSSHRYMYVQSVNVNRVESRVQDFVIHEV